MVNYIGKTKLYKEVLEHVSYSDIPKCKDSHYSKLKNNIELLSFTVSFDDGDTILVVKSLRTNYCLSIIVRDFDTDEIIDRKFILKH